MREKKVEMDIIQTEKNQNKGITLIALIITIVILLILAGVTIQTVLGDGLITHAKNARNLTELSTLKEQLELYKIMHLNENINITNNEIDIILPSLKNTKYRNVTSLENNKIRIDMQGKKLSEVEKNYIDSNRDTFYFVEYGVDTEWEIIVANEEEKTCKISNIFQKNVINNVLRIPDYIIKDGVRYKVIGNEHSTAKETVTANKIHIPDTFLILSNLGKIDGCEEIYIEDGLSEIGYGCFLGFSSLKYIRLPNSLTSISGAAFWQCKALTDLSIPDSVTYIGEQAFCGSGLTQVIMPNSITNIGNQLFQDCFQLEFVKFPDNITILPIGTFVNSKCKKIQLPLNLVEIGDRALTSSEFRTIEIPEGVRKLGDNLFYATVKEIRVPDSVNEVGQFLYKDGVNLNTGVIVYTDNPKVIEYVKQTNATIKSYKEWNK